MVHYIYIIYIKYIFLDLLKKTKMFCLLSFSQPPVTRCGCALSPRLSGYPPPFS